ncbi:hypothetical protein ACWKWJ_03010 [Sphingopyxis terrae subsp. ummariensis]
MTIKRRDTLAILAGVTLAPAIYRCASARDALPPTGSGDDSEALIALFAEMAKTGRASLPDGIYKVSKPLVIPPGVLAGGNVVLDFRGANPADFPAGICVRVNGAARTKLPNLVRNLAIGERTLKFSAPHGLRVGEAFQLSGTEDFAGNGYRYYYRKGEMFRVARVIDATQVAVENGCRDDYPAHATEVWKRAGDRFTQGCKSLRVIGRDDIGYTMQLASLDGAAINNIRCEGGKLAALSITDCYQMSGENVDAHQTADGSTNPYGCIVGNSQDVRLHGEFYGHFSGFAIGGGKTDGGKVGMNRDIHFEGKAGSHPVAGLAGGNIHGNAEYCSLRGTFANGVVMGGNKNEAHGEFFKSARPPVILAEMHGHDFRVTGLLRTIGDDDLSPKVGALHQSDYGMHARYGGVTEVSLQIHAPTATRIVAWRPRNLARDDIELRLSLDIVKAHPKTRIMWFRRNGSKGDVLPLVTLDRINLIDNAIPIIWSVDPLTRFQGAGVRAMAGHR